MLGDFRGKRAAKRSKKTRGRVAADRARAAVFEVLELRNALRKHLHAINEHRRQQFDLGQQFAIGHRRRERHAGTQTDTIVLTSGTYTLSLGQLAVTSTAHTLIIDGQGSTGRNATMIDQTALDRVFQINSGVTVIFENLEITGGTAETDASGGTTEAEGGGILNQGNLTLNNVAVIGNTAKATLPGESAFGGGIFTPAPCRSRVHAGRQPDRAKFRHRMQGADGVNRATAAMAKGAASIRAPSAQVQITGTTIANNTATGGNGPTAISSDNYKPTAKPYMAMLPARGLEVDSTPAITPRRRPPSWTATPSPTTGHRRNGGTGGAGQNGGTGDFGIGGGVAIELHFHE